MTATAPVEPEAAARAALRLRQGPGARFDASAAPAGDLLVARRGMAYFARRLNELTDAGLAEASARPGVSRRHVIAEVGCRARQLAIALSFARTGEPPDREGQPVPALAEEIALAATLPAVALRHLYTHAQVHLDVEWRDLQDADWDGTMPDEHGALVERRRTPLVWARFIWQAALDLRNGGREADLPASLGKPG